jgi:hypothetical protein
MSKRKRIARIFRMRGLMVQSSALDALLSVLSREDYGDGGRDYDETLYAIIDEVKGRMVNGRGFGGGGGRRGGGDDAAMNVVTPTLLGMVVADLSRTGRDAYDESVQYLDTFRTPRLSYDPMRRNFDLIVDCGGGGGNKGSIYGEALDKVRARACVCCARVCLIPIFGFLYSFLFAPLRPACVVFVGC